MALSLKKAFGGGAGVELGECVMLHDQPEPLLVLDGMEFLKSGNVLTDEEATYPEAFQKFGAEVAKGGDWIQVPSNFPNNTLNCVTYAGGVWFAVGDRASLYITSPDGVNWTQHTDPNLAFNVRAVKYSDGLWVIAGSGGQICTSTDGVNWELRVAKLSAYQIMTLVGTPTLWLAGGAGGLIFGSPDGIVWTNSANTSFGTGTVQALAHGNGLFVAAGTGFNGSASFAILATSPDGITWTSRETNLSVGQYLLGVAYGNGLWVAVGFGPALVTSPDGIIWTERESGSSGLLLRSVAYGNGLWVAIGHGGELVTSSDGMSWTVQPDGHGGTQPYSVDYGNGKWVTVGQQGKVAVSLPTPTIGLQTETKDGASTQYMRVK